MQSNDDPSGLSGLSGSWLRLQAPSRPLRESSPEVCNPALDADRGVLPTKHAVRQNVVGAAVLGSVRIGLVLDAGSDREERSSKRLPQWRHVNVIL